MFFWGVGTSKIASNSFSWDETAAAAALAGENVMPCNAWLSKLLPVDFPLHHTSRVTLPAGVLELLFFMLARECRAKQRLGEDCASLLRLPKPDGPLALAGCILSYTTYETENCPGLVGSLVCCAL